MDRFNNRLQEFMRGRYGADELERFLMVVTVILIVINFFVGSRLLNLIVTALLIWSFFRMLSRNFTARSNENMAFVRHRDTVLSKINRGRLSGGSGSGGKKASSDRAYHYFSCPSCGQRVRVPRGRGRVRIICPKCRTEFEKKA